MIWKQELKKLEELKEWDDAIKLLQNIITEYSDNLDAHLSMNFLLMNLLINEEHPQGFKHDYYSKLLKYYFDESYSKFSNNPEYLFYTGITGTMAEWYFGIDFETAELFLKQAENLEPNNVLYQWGYYGCLSEIQNKNKEYYYGSIILKENSHYRKALQSKGALGEYILSIIANSNKRIEKELANKNKQ